MNVAFTLIAASFRVESSHRLQTLMLALGSLIQVFARISIWSAVYGERTTVADISLDQMIAYALIGSTILSSGDSTGMVRDIGTTIRTGAIASTLLRPVGYPLMLLCEQLGARLFNMALVSFPVIVITAIFLGVEPPASALHGILFPFYLVLSILILMLTGTAVGILAFWVLDAHALEWFQRGLLAVFSGGLVPLWFFPPGLAEIANALPFAWITYHPMAVYLGQHDPGSALSNLGIGIGWLCLLAGLVALLWSRACRQVVVQGG